MDCESCVATGRVKVPEGPVHEVHVQVISAEFCQGLPASRDDVFWRMLVIPEFGRYPKLVSRKILQNRANEVLILVNRSAVEMSVTDFKGAFYSASHLFRREAVGAESTKPDGRSNT